VILRALAAASLAVLLNLSAAAILVPGAAAQQAFQKGDFAVQVGSHRKEESAQAGWTILTEKEPDLFAGLTLDIQRADLGDQGIYYRMQTGPFPNKATADDFCFSLKARKISCLVIRR
jgi:cell division protein FtsN